LIWERAFAFRDETSVLRIGYHRQLGADVPLAADGPTTLTLTTPPPTYEPHELQLVNSRVRLAEGVIVAYEDVNGNRQLDLQGHTSEAYVDALAAHNPNLRLVYADGIASDEEAAAMTRRYGIRIENGLGVLHVAREAGAPSPFPASPAYGRLEHFTELGHSYELEALPSVSGGSNPIDVDRLMCELEPIRVPQQRLWPNFYLDGRPPVYPKPDGGENRIVEIVCAEDGSYLEEWGCDLSSWRSPCLGRESKDNCRVTVWYRPAPVPSDWPCP
jgi:hypothetical protein